MYLCAFSRAFTFSPIIFCSCSCLFIPNHQPFKCSFLAHSAAAGATEQSRRIKHLQSIFILCLTLFRASLFLVLTFAFDASKSGLDFNGPQFNEASHQCFMSLPITSGKSIFTQSQTKKQWPLRLYIFLTRDSSDECIIKVSCEGFPSLHIYLLTRICNSKDAFRMYIYFG